jgi:hypothetical protein
MKALHESDLIENINLKSWVAAIDIILDYFPRKRSDSVHWLWAV